MTNKRIKFPSEILYFLAIVVIAFAVALTTAADFGVSMIVAPAYIVSLRVDILSFGQSEYIVQGVFFVLLCVLMKRVKPLYFASFLTSVIYGAVLDLFRTAIPHFNPDITPAGSLDMPVRIVYFILGMALTSLAVAMFFRTYLYPQVYDFFVKAVSEKYGIDRTKFKIVYDVSMLVLSCVLSFALFGGIKGVGVGTLVLTACNGALIGLFGKLLDRFFSFNALIPGLERKFLG